MSPQRPSDPFSGSTLTCTGTPYGGFDPCTCTYCLLTRHFTPQPLPRPNPPSPLPSLRAFSKRRIFRDTKKPNQSEAMF